MPNHDYMDFGLGPGVSGQDQQQEYWLLSPDRAGDARFDRPYLGTFMPGELDVAGGSTGQRPPEPRPPSFIDIPDWLRDLAKYGYGSSWMRSKYLKAAEPMGEQSTTAKRQLWRQGLLSGASHTGFLVEAQKQLDFAREKALKDLDIALKTENENMKMQAKQQLEALEYQNRRMKEQWKNWSEARRLLEMQRAWQLEAAAKEFEAQKPLPWYEQLIGAGLKLGAQYLGANLALGG